MKIHSSFTLPNNIKLLIIEIDDQFAVNNFDNRFELAVEYKGKRFFPKNKRNFLEFTNNDYLYPILNGKNGTPIMLKSELFCSLNLCNKSLEDVNTEVLAYMSMYNQGIDLKRELKKVYSI